MQLKPVTFRYRTAEADGSKPIQYGPIAEDVAKVFPELVGYDQDGKPDAVAYQTLSSLLLNEFQKQQRDIETSHAVIAEMQRESRGREAELLALHSEVAELKQLTTQLLATHKANDRLVANTR